MKILVKVLTWVMGRKNWLFLKFMEYKVSVGHSSSVDSGVSVWHLVSLDSPAESLWKCLNFMMKTPTQSIKIMED